MKFTLSLASEFILFNDAHELIRALGTDEPLFNMKTGQLHASLDRVEAILTHSEAADI